jgi:hypothetical protein
MFATEGVETCDDGCGFCNSGAGRDGAGGDGGDGGTGGDNSEGRIVGAGDVGHDNLPHDGVKGVDGAGSSGVVIRVDMPVGDGGSGEIG